MAFRSDRITSLYIFHPLRRLPLSRVKIPVLMYHSISDLDDSTRHPYYRTVTSPAVFDQHLKWLHDRGYKTINLSEAVALLGGSTAVVERPVVITFDDGFKNFYSEAFPTLGRYGFSGIVFLPTAFIDDSPQKFRGTACMTWSQVRELKKAGIEFGSHTVTHPQLRNLETEEIRRELRDSKAKIEDELSGSITSFAYPYAFPETDGAFRQRLKGILQESGYENGVSTIIGTVGPTADSFFMKRLPINSYDDLRLFEAKVEGGYDWLHAFQYASKLRYRSA